MEETQNNLEQQPIINQPKLRPQMLSVLCILTFIWSGLAIFSNLFFSLFFDLIKEIIPTIELPSNYKEMKDGLLLIISAGRFFFVSGLLLNSFTLFGAIKMWKLQKNGFHFYTISQIILLMLPLLFIKGGGFQIIEFLITAMFVMMYASHLKVMK